MRGNGGIAGTSAVALAVALGLVAAACTGGGTDDAPVDIAPEALISAADGGAIGLPDGSVRLDVPPGALAEDATISVAPVDEPDWPDELTGAEEVRAVYRFEPDGLTFSEPATLTVRRPQDLQEGDGAIGVGLLLTRSSDGQWELLERPTTETDLGGDVVATSASLSHFSDVVDVTGPALVALTPKSVTTSPGGTWTATAVVENVSEASGLDITNRAGFDSQWTTSGQVESAPGQGAIPETIVPIGQRERLEHDFTCVEEPGGSYGLSLQLAVDFSGMDWMVLMLAGRESTARAWVRVTGTARCATGAPDATEDTTTQDILDELPDDCTKPKEGERTCLIDAVGYEVEFVAAGTAAGAGVARVATVAGDACEALRVTVVTDSDLDALDPTLQGEVVMQVHPAGGAIDGSADTGVGMSLRDGEWSMFRFGPGDAEPAEAAVSARVEGTDAILQLDGLADGTCITEDDELRIKLEAQEGPTGDRIYDLVGVEGLMEYRPVRAYLADPGAASG